MALQDPLKDRDVHEELWCGLQAEPALNQGTDRHQPCSYLQEWGSGSYLGGESLDRLQVEVVVQVEIVEVLAVDQQVQHVVTLAADLKAHLHPVQLG